MPNKDERVILTYEQLESILPDGDNIHTFMQGGPCLVGADWRREQIIEAAKEHVTELAGGMATGMGHGAVINRPNGPLFVETDKKKLATLNASIEA